MWRFSFHRTRARGKASEDETGNVSEAIVFTEPHALPWAYPPMHSWMRRVMTGGASGVSGKMRVAAPQSNRLVDAHLDFSGNAWTCNPGFESQGKQCLSDNPVAENLPARVLSIAGDQSTRSARSRPSHSPPETGRLPAATRVVFMHQPRIVAADARARGIAYITL